jgi:hypothetical protein
MHLRRFAWIPALITVMILPVSSIHAADYTQYLPGDTEFVLHANIRQALDSPLGKKYLLPQIEENLKKGKPEIQEVLTALGLDPIKDVTSITLAAPGKINEKNWTALLEGRFDQAKIQSTVESFASNPAGTLKTHKEDGAVIYEFQDTKHSQSAFAAFVEKDTLLVSSTKDQVTAALGKKGTSKGSSLNKDLLALMKEGDKESLWLAMVPDQVIKALPQNNKQLLELAKKIKSIKGGITLTDGVQFSVRIQTPDPKAARDVRQTVDGFRAMLVFLISTTDQLKDFGPTLTDILNSIKFTLDKSAVGIDLMVTGKQIEDAVPRQSELKK